MTRYTLKDKLDCAHREVSQRKRVYARLVAEHRMSQKKADYEIAVMEAITEDYRAQLRQKVGDWPELFP